MLAEDRPRNQNYAKKWQQISAQSVSFLENYKYEKRN